MKLLFIAILATSTACSTRLHTGTGCTYYKRGFNRIPADTINAKP